MYRFASSIRLFLLTAICAQSPEQAEIWQQNTGHTCGRTVQFGDSEGLTLSAELRAALVDPTLMPATQCSLIIGREPFDDRIALSDAVCEQHLQNHAFGSYTADMRDAEFASQVARGVYRDVCARLHSASDMMPSCASSGGADSEIALYDFSCELLSHG